MAPESREQTSLRMLIVDDDDLQLRTIADIMRAEGFEVVGCATASEALRHLERGEVDVAVVDLRLPDLSEAELLRKLFAYSYEIPIILNTGHASLRSAKDAVNFGVFAYVEKAGDPAQLVHHVHRAVQTRLRRYASALEKAVSERTRQLQRVNQALKRQIAERKQVEDALRTSEANYRAIFNAANDAIFVHDPESGAILDVNAGMCQMFGYTREEADGLTIEDLSSGRPPFTQADALEWVRKTARGRPQRFEWMAKDRRGRLFWVEVNLKLARIGGRDRILAVVRDVSERKTAEQRLARSREALRSLAARLQVVREEERTRLARKFHDDVGHALIGLRMDLAWLGRNIAKSRDLSKSPEVSQRLQSMVRVIGETIQTARQTASDLRPGLLDDEGLAATIAWQASQFETRTGLKCVFVGSEDGLGLSPGQTTALFRICQELLTNVAQHAGATTVRILLTRRANSLVLEVSDDGKGITDDQVASSESLGILGMRERALILGGELAITGRPGKGTTATVQIPLTADAQTKRPEDATSQA